MPVRWHTYLYSSSAPIRSGAVLSRRTSPFGLESVAGRRGAIGACAMVWRKMLNGGRPAPERRGRWCRFLIPRLAFALAALYSVGAVEAAGDQSPAKLSPQLLDAVVRIHAEVSPGARTAIYLGSEREGSGVLIDADGLIVTIGYLVTEA